MLCAVGDKVNVADLLVQPVRGCFASQRDVTLETVQRSLQAQIDGSGGSAKISNFVRRRVNELVAEAFEASAIPVMGSTMSLVPIRLVTQLVGDVWMLTRGVPQWQRVLKPDLVQAGRLVYLNYTRSKFRDYAQGKGGKGKGKGNLCSRV